MNKISWWFTEIGETEKNKLTEAFDSKRFSLGPLTLELEKQFALKHHIPYAVVVPSGTAAISAALLAVGVGPGDEVIVPDLTWIATAQAAAVLGAKVVCADCLPNIPLVDVSQISTLR